MFRYDNFIYLAYTYSLYNLPGDDMLLSFTPPYQSDMFIAPGAFIFK